MLGNVILYIQGKRYSRSKDTIGAIHESQYCGRPAYMRIDKFLFFRIMLSISSVYRPTHSIHGMKTPEYSTTHSIILVNVSEPLSLTPPSHLVCETSLRSLKYDKPIQVTPEPLFAHPNLTSLFKLHPNHCFRTKINQLINQLYPPPSCDHIQTF